MQVGTQLGTVAQCWRYPVKSMQGATTSRLRIGSHGVAGDRAHALVDDSTERVLSAKSVPELLWASADDESIRLPDGTTVALDDEDRDGRLSAWLDRAVRLLTLEQSGLPAELGLSYEMTFDPPDDTAEAFEIPIPDGTFVDLAPIHLLTTATLAGCAERRPDLDWDVRRFRPNVVVDVAGPAFVEQGWVGREVAVGGAVLRVTQPTVRCAMPLRAQPAAGADRPALDRAAALFSAMTELNEAAPNHLGVYAEVVAPGEVAVGDAVVIGPG